MKTIKLSYSILNAWKQGDIDNAIRMYLGEEIPLTPQIEIGRIYDKKWNEYIEKHKHMPEELGKFNLKNPKVQKKYSLIIPFSDKYQILLRGVIDVLEDDCITDNKCGRTTATEYVNTSQLDYYSLFLPNISVGRYICYNPYIKKHTVGIKFFTKNTRENALNEIITLGGELLNYLLKEDLFIDYEIEAQKL